MEPLTEELESQLALLDAMRGVYPGDPDDGILASMNDILEKLGRPRIVPVKVIVERSDG